MPLYEYECKSCGRVLEIIQKFSDPALTECPQCKGPITKLMSLTSFQLRGTGWYATDYKKSEPTTKAAKPKECSTKTKAEGQCACHEAAKIKNLSP